MKRMETKKCKNKKCQRPLPKEYKYKYCENCRNEQVNSVKKIIKNVGSGVLVAIGETAGAVISAICFFS